MEGGEQRGEEWSKARARHLRVFVLWCHPESQVGGFNPEAVFRVRQRPVPQGKDGQNRRLMRGTCVVPPPALGGGMATFDSSEHRF